jgi:hypothetical protein
MIHAELTRTDDELVHQMSKGLMSPIGYHRSTENDHQDVNMGPHTWRNLQKLVIVYLPVIYYILIPLSP